MFMIRKTLLQELDYLTKDIKFHADLQAYCTALFGDVYYKEFNETFDCVHVSQRWNEKRKRQQELEAFRVDVLEVDRARMFEKIKEFKSLIDSLSPSPSS